MDFRPAHYQDFSHRYTGGQITLPPIIKGEKKMTIQMQLENMGHAFRSAQVKGYYSTSHSLTSALAWALLQCPALRPSVVLQWWRTGYAMV